MRKTSKAAAAIPAGIRTWLAHHPRRRSRSARGHQATIATRAAMRYWKSSRFMFGPGGSAGRSNPPAVGYSLVVGSMLLRTRDIRLAGNPDICACFRIASSSGAM